MKKQVKIVSVCTLFVLIGCLTIGINQVEERDNENSPHTLHTENTGEGDYSGLCLEEVPDKYNTGANHVHLEKEELQVLDLTTEKVVKTENGGVIRASQSGYLLNLSKDKKNYGKVFRNIDFTGTKLPEGVENRFFVSYSSDSESDKGTVRFENCIFPYMTFGNKVVHNVRWIFIDCTFTDGVAISNAEFHNCQFGSDVRGADVQCDYNTLFEDCYFWYANEYIGGTGSHVDGIQVSGIQDYTSGNIVIRHCAFDIPCLKLGRESGAENQDMVNACIMIQPDFGPIDGICVEQCWMTGGGYSMYLFPKKADISNAAVLDMSIGCSAVYGELYPTTPEKYKWENVRNAKTVTIGAVWVEGNEICISVTNRTNNAHELCFKTNAGKSYCFAIEKCPMYEEMSDKTRFENLPFNRIFRIAAEKVELIECYDGDTLIYKAALDIEEETGK